MCEPHPRELEWGIGTCVRTERPGDLIAQSEVGTGVGQMTHYPHASAV